MFWRKCSRKMDDLLFDNMYLQGKIFSLERSFEILRLRYKNSLVIRADLEMQLDAFKEALKKADPDAYKGILKNLLEERMKG